MNCAGEYPPTHRDLKPVRSPERIAMLASRPIRYLAAALTASCGLLPSVDAAASQPTAEPLTKAQQNCIISNNNLGVRIFSAQAGVGEGCVKDAGKGSLATTVDLCLVDLQGGKAAKLSEKLVRAQEKKCASPLPPFGFRPAELISASATAGTVMIIEELFGKPVDPAVVRRDDYTGDDGVKCQLQLVDASATYAEARLKEFKNCKKKSLKQKTIVDVTELGEGCVTADPRGKVAAARTRITDTLAAKCDPAQLAALFPGRCAPSATTLDAFGLCIAQRVDCETCVLTNAMDGLLFDCDLLDDGIANASCRTCGNGSVEVSESCDDGGESSSCDIDCTLPVCGDGLLNASAGELCDDGNGVDGDGCDDGCVPSACGNGVIGGELEQCDDGNTVGGDGCGAFCQCEPEAFLSGCQDPRCPSSVELYQLAAVGRDCAANADCAAGTCDETLLKCLTATTDDLGYTGIVHNVDSDEGSVTRLRLTCPGPAPVCGACIVDGIDPRPRNCRCANDTRQICDEPLRPDADDCGGAICECYEGPPSPHSTANTPVCTLWRHAADVSGTVDVDSGTGVLDKDLIATVHFGEQLVDPCPRCVDDIAIDDGVRHGTCLNGPHDGLPCDVNAVHTSFPAPGGGDYSLDCMPNPANNLSGSGVRIRATLTTGESTLASGIECGFAVSPELCPCGVCSGDASMACASNTDCAGLGTCGPRQDGIPTANTCLDGTCTDVGGGEGKCLENLVSFCDGVLRADGRPFVQCVEDADCDSTDCGGVSCGACALSEPLDCFLPEIVALGQADPLRPLRAASYCIPPSASGVNVVVGLPGPARMVRQEIARYLCSGTAEDEYVPGVGGCP